MSHDLACALCLKTSHVGTSHCASHCDSKTAAPLNSGSFPKKSDLKDTPKEVQISETVPERTAKQLRNPYGIVWRTLL